MDGDRIEIAVKRIEDALARIARAADTVRPAPPSVSALVVRHEALRDQVAGTIEDIDALIESLAE